MNSCGTLLLPCITSGKPGQVFMICSMRLNASLASCLNLKAPWLVPMATARLSMPGPLVEILRLLRIGQKLLDVLFVFLGVQPDDVFLDSAEHSQFGLDHHAGGVGNLHRLSGQLDVLFVRMMAAVDHDAGVAVVDAGLDQIERVAMIAVDGDRQFRMFLDRRIDDLP